MRIRITFLSIKGLLFLAALCSFAGIQAQEVIFNENFGTATSEKDELIEDHGWSYLPESGIGYTLYGSIERAHQQPLGLYERIG